MYKNILSFAITLCLWMACIHTDDERYDISHEESQVMKPFAIIPGLLSGELKGKYDYRREYSPQLRQIYGQYLGDNPFLTNCSEQNGKASDIGADEMQWALTQADQQIKEYESINDPLIENSLVLQSFSKYLYNIHIHSKYNEYVSRNLAKIKCLNKEQSALKLQTIAFPDEVKNNGALCYAECDVSIDVVCDPGAKYSRLDGKCNNLLHTNWGSNYSCYRSLLPSNYGDGVSRVQVARDGSELPLTRVVTNELIPRRDIFDTTHTGMHMMWGQYIAHDSFKLVKLFGSGLSCCPRDGTAPNEECNNNSPVPPDQLLNAFNQSCMSLMRGVACNACRLGARTPINAATHTLDLSHLYGGNNNNSNEMRLFSGGLLVTNTSLDNKTNVLTNLIVTNETVDLIPCLPPATRPWLTCFETGDGIRGNQQPMIQALHVMMTRRHNQHALSLARVNTHWNDERLFQEARRLMIAEYQCINYKEYFPATVGTDIQRYFDLELKTGDAFTKYNPNVNPNSMTEVNVGAFRYAHSQIATIFHAIHKLHYKSYGFQLRDKYFEPSDVWDGNSAALIRGLIDDPETAFDQYSVPDVLDYFNFDSVLPTVIDLHSDDIQRSRDFGVPGYVYHAEYCSGIRIESWDDLTVLIPEHSINKLKNVYKDYRDIDLIIGGFYERPRNDSLMGPIFDCLNAMQFFHWKFGDRFYFEHRDQTGSFTREQLTNIRRTSSLANTICKTTDTESTQANVMLKTSATNPRNHCHKYPEFDYNLWRE